MKALSLFLVIITSAAAAVPVTPAYDGMPPARFEGPAKLKVVFGRVDLCGTSSFGTFEACVRKGVTYLPDPCAYGDREEFARLACHEIAHVRGWGPNHGD
jgi:hypothetical protein